MQQTNTYKLDLIEPSDTFSADPLNGNARKLETALTGTRADLERSLAGVKSGLEAALAGVQTGQDQKTAELSAADAALSARIDALAGRATALEAHKIAVGAYTGNGREQTISLGFTPVAVLVHVGNINGSYSALAVTDHPAYYLHQNCRQIVIISGGFTVCGSGETPLYNRSGETYFYLALS